MSTMTKTTARFTESPHKKSTSGEAPIPEQDYGTTPEQKSEAERLFDKIGTGAAYAVRRPKDAKVDRQLRRIIAKANMSGGDCIINSGTGYYRPGPEEREELEIYLKKEMHRIRELKLKALRMSLAYNRRYQTNE